MRTALLQQTCLTLATVAALFIAQPAPAQPADMAQDEELAYTIGVQAYLYSYPTMDLYRTLYETSIDPARGREASLNEFDHRRRLTTHEDTWVVTPNEDTLYSFAFLDLRAEPIILDIPPMGGRQYWFPVGDMFHNFDANLSWDTVGSRGGAFALCERGWSGVLPEGVKRVDTSTPIVWIGGRYAVSGRDDVANAIALQDKTRLVPLGLWGRPDVPRPKINASAYPVLTRKDLADPGKYWTVLNEVLRITPRSGSAADAAMLAWLREVGFQPDRRFDMSSLSPATRRGLERAVVDGHAIITRRLPRAVPSVNNWQIVRLDKDTSDDFMLSAAAAMLGLLYNPQQVSTYDLTFIDGNGDLLDGNQTYTLHLNPPPPVNAFWSLTMYSAKTRGFIPSSINRYSVGDRTPALVYGPDGSLTIHMSKEEPKDRDARANWLPAPDGPFYLVIRHYSPKAAVLTGDWLPPKIQKHEGDGRRGG